MIRYISLLYTALAIVALAFTQVSVSHAGATTYIYDDLDRVKEVWFDNTNYIAYEYDEVGNLLSKTPQGNTSRITASTTDGGNIYPSGTTTFFKGGNVTYSIVPNLGQPVATVYVDGLLQGQVTSFTFTNLTVDHTISAAFTNQLYPVSFIGGTGGSLTGATSQTVNVNGTATSVTAVPNPGYYFVNWTGTGAFIPTGSNPLIVSNVVEPLNITANFASYLVLIARPIPAYFNSIQAAYNAAVDGDVIRSHSVSFPENVIINRNISITLDGGYSLDFVTKAGTTLLKGALTTTIDAGTVNIKEFSIQNY